MLLGPCVCILPFEDIYIYIFFIKTNKCIKLRIKKHKRRMRNPPKNTTDLLMLHCFS